MDFESVRVESKQFAQSRSPFPVMTNELSVEFEYASQSGIKLFTLFYILESLS